MRLLLAVFLVIASLVFVGQAAAASSTQDAYGGVLGEQAAGGGNSTGTPAGTAAVAPAADVTAASDSGSLPFTGGEAALVVAIGAGLLGTGLVVRRATRSRD